MDKETLRVSVENGKYTYVMEPDGRVYALRYGEPWREQDLIGDKMILCMAQEIDRLRSLLGRVEVHLDMNDKYDTDLWHEIVSVLEEGKK